MKLLTLAREALAISEAGLKARARIEEGADESRFLSPLRESVASGEVPADRLLKLYYNDWDEELGPVYDACRY